MTTSAPTLPGTLRSAPAAAAISRARVEAVVAIAFGVALMLAMQGYHFGKSNHTVYLIDALRGRSPDLLQNDWFATQTLQYHGAFSLLTRGLMKLGILEPAFLLGHIALAILLHVAWWKIVRASGGGVAVFLLSLVFFHVPAAGTGLGMYQFLQDGGFLPSNIASVAFLWGICLWMTGQRGWSAVLFGVSGLFHLNYAIVAPAVWVGLAMASGIIDRRRLTLLEWFGGVAMLELCLMNIVPALIAVSQRSGRMPLEEFVQIYVRLRHPHHYAPLEWPMALWVSFLWPLPFAWAYWAPRDDERTTQIRRVLAFILLLLVIAFVGAGVCYVSETLVQLSLWRFSVFVKLLTCIGAAAWLVTMLRRERVIAAVSSVVGVALLATCLVRGPYLGLFGVVEDDGDYLAACDWIRTNTPVGAVFLVPPDEQAFRLRAQRAIVVNYKCVPQLSGELPAWSERLGDVLLLDIRDLPTPFDRTLREIRRRYEGRRPEHYADVAERYGARYVLVGHSLGEEWEPKRVVEMAGATQSYLLYDLQR